MKIQFFSIVVWYTIVFQKQERQIDGSFPCFRKMSLRFQSSAKQMLNPSKSIFAQKKEQSLADAGRNSDPRQKIHPYNYS